MTPLTFFVSQERGSAFQLPDIYIKDGYILVPEQVFVGHRRWRLNHHVKISACCQWNSCWGLKNSNPTSDCEHFEVLRNSAGLMLYHPWTSIELHFLTLLWWCQRSLLPLFSILLWFLNSWSGESLDSTNQVPLSNSKTLKKSKFLLGLWLMVKSHEPSPPITFNYEGVF